LYAQICFGWGVGISRIIDNKHSTADVVGGFVLGAMFGLVFVLKVSTNTCKLALSLLTSACMLHLDRMDASHLVAMTECCRRHLNAGTFLLCAGHPDRQICRGTR
jgi:PAP2 superfamily